MPTKPANPRMIAQDILSRRDNSEYEMRQKLAKKFISQEEIEETIIWLKSKKYLNDTALAHRYIEEVMRRKAVGKKYIAYKLREKHIHSSIVEEALTELFTPDVEKELMQKAATAWKKSHPTHAADNVRLARFLLSRGFSQPVSTLQ